MIGLEKSADGGIVDQWGVQFVSDPATQIILPVFVIANPLIVETMFNPTYTDNNQFFAEGITNRSKDEDGKIATMHWKRYLYFLRNGDTKIILMSINNTYFDDSVDACIAPDKINDITPEKLLWQVVSH